MPISDRYMMATRARTARITGSPAAGHDISRDEPSLAIVYRETETDYIGEWAAGFGFVDVHFPKDTTRELTDAEKALYRGKVIEVGGMTRPILIPCCDLHNQSCEPPAELCCRSCTEAGHPEHPRGVQCVLATRPKLCCEFHANRPNGLPCDGACCHECDGLTGPGVPIELPAEFVLTDEEFAATSIRMPQAAPVPDLAIPFCPTCGDPVTSGCYPAQGICAVVDGDETATAPNPGGAL